MAFAAPVCLAGALAGCGGPGAISAPASPVVEAGSGEFREAQARDEAVRRRSEAAEARLRKRHPGLIVEE